MNDYIGTGIRAEDIKKPTSPKRPDFNSDSPKEQLLEIVKNTTIPYEYMDDPLIKKYGVYVDGVYPEWIWYDKENLSDYGYESGCRPLKDAPEIDLYKIIALCEKHWREFYKSIYEKRKKINKDQETAKIKSFSEIMSEVKTTCSYGAGFSDGIEIQAKKIEAATQIYIAQLQINSK